VVAASDPERHEAALAEALVERGLDLWLELRDDGDPRADQALELLLRWIGGEQLTERADEPERRLLAAEDALDAFGDEVSSLHRLHAQAVLSMPPGHEERDVEGAVAELRASLDAARAEDDAEEAVRTVAALLEADAGDEELLDEGDRWAEAADQDGAETFRLAAESFTAGRHIEARDDGDESGAGRWAERHARYVADDDGGLGALASRAGQLDMAQRYDEAADAYRTIVEGSDLEWSSVQAMAVREGELRLMLGELDRAVEALAHALPYVEAQYLTAVTETDVEEAQESLDSATGALAAALARQEDWGGVLQVLDRGQGLRGRYRAALRLDPAGDRLLALERELDAALRGAADDPVSARARLLEEYRQVRPRLGAERLESPSVDDVGAVLESGEAVVVIGFHFTGTVAIVIAPGDAGEPSGRLLLEDVATYQWLELFSSGDWLTTLIEPGSGVEFEPGLSTMIAGVDEHVGRWLRGVLDERGLQRVTVVPDSMLHLIPWAALPSLRGVDVVMAASVSETVRGRPGAVPAPRTALVVANPTLDLRVSAAACRPVVDRLAGAEFDVVEIGSTAATEPALVQALTGRAVLHFAGHGRSEGLVSGLEVHPDRDLGDWAVAWRELEPPEDDDDPPWRERLADVPGVGRLAERRWTRVDRVDRRLEYAGGTLVATYAGDRRLRLAELWSASDLMLTERLGDCRVAVLVACASGAGVGRSDEAKAGIPVALQLAGIDTVIGTHWEVDEGFAALWAECFYRGFEGARVDVAALVRRTGDELRSMSAADARERLLAIADRAEDPFAAMELEAYAHRLVDPPFAAPEHWAAFYVIGRPTIEFAP